MGLEIRSSLVVVTRQREEITHLREVSMGSTASEIVSRETKISLREIVTVLMDPSMTFKAM